MNNLGSYAEALGLLAEMKKRAEGQDTERAKVSVRTLDMAMLIIDKVWCDEREEMEEYYRKQNEELERESAKQTAELAEQEANTQHLTELTETEDKEKWL